ncbi:DapH/DapD/GlmU-related protein [Altererythrobacter sp. ZODW24]|uniref:DapH/DapD/GlmU-related protein n=1 Tax=Altererythrobacter sp. ZODW24 TaxID=2185142 RepID=UPI000DF86091|nr:DapH/DapD/GlmU-related protein [Altererythrobacter sp. ZODW24]
MSSSLTDKALRILAKLVGRGNSLLSADKAEHLRASMQRCGVGGNIDPTVTVMDPLGLSVGNNVFIGADCFIHAEGGVQIRDNTHISRRVTIYGSDHDFRAEARLPYGKTRSWRQVIIGRNVWIGMNASILPGVTIGDGAIVAMGAIVSKDVQPGEIVASAGQRTIGQRDAAITVAADDADAYGGKNGQPLSPAQVATQWPTAREREPRIVFVASTGRSGTQTLGNWCNRHPQINGQHEPRRQLIKWSTELDEGKIDKAEATALIRDLYLDGSVYDPAKIHLESDQKFYNLIPILQDALPNSKFIWLVRQSPKVVASVIGRGWYSQEAENFQESKNPWFREHWRVQGNLTSPAVEGFAAMSQFEKCAWYWAHVNRSIEAAFDGLPENRKLLVRLEDLSDQADDIISFAGAPPHSIPVTQENKAVHGRHKTEAWTSEEHQIHEKWCGEIMDRLYPDWR